MSDTTRSIFDEIAEAARGGSSPKGSPIIDKLISGFGNIAREAIDLLVSNFRADWNSVPDKKLALEMCMDLGERGANTVATETLTKKHIPLDITNLPRCSTRIFFDFLNSSPDGILDKSGELAKWKAKTEEEILKDPRYYAYSSAYGKMICDVCALYEGACQLKGRKITIEDLKGLSELIMKMRKEGK